MEARLRGVDCPSSWGAGLGLGSLKSRVLEFRCGCCRCRVARAC